MSDEKVTAPALGISVSVKVNDKRDIVFQTHIAQEADAKDLNALLDKIGAAADRQVAKYMLDDLGRTLEVHEKTLRQMNEDAERLQADERQTWEDGGRRGPYKMSKKSEAAVNNIAMNRKRFETEIGKIKEEIERNRALVGA